MTRTSLLPRAITAALVLAATAVLTVSAVAQQPAGNQSAQPTSGPANADLKDVTRHPENYIGKTIVVEGEAIDVLGPHLFVVDARKWFHLWGGMLVVVPEPFAAIVRRDAPVRVTGTVEKVVLAEARRKWSFLNDPGVEVDLFEKPVIVATEVTTVTPTVVSLKFQPGQPVGTSGSGSPAAIKDIAQFARAVDSSLVGRRVDLSGTVTRTEGDGFWLRAPSGQEVFVVPSSKASVKASEKIAVQGIVLETPRRADGQGNKARTQPVYVFADRVTPK